MKSSTTGQLFSGASVLMIALFVVTGCQQQRVDPSQKLKPIVDKYEEIWNTGNVDELDAIMDPNYVFHANKSPEVSGVENRKKMLSSTRTAYPDLKLVVEDLLFSENAGAGRWHITGTNTGAGEAPPTGKPVDYWGIAILHFANGKIKEEWTAYDNQSIMEQLGYVMMPPNIKKQ